MEVSVSLYIHQAVPIVSDLAQNVSRVMPRDASQWDGNQRRTNANEVPVKNVSRNVKLVKVGFEDYKIESLRLHHVVYMLDLTTFSLV